MHREASKYSDKSVAENISAAELLPLKWETGSLRHFNIVERWTAAFLNSGPIYARPHFQMPQ